MPPISRDVAAAWDTIRAYLGADPVGHNLPLSLINSQLTAVEPTADEVGRYWWARRSGVVVGACIQFDPGTPCVVAADDRAVVLALVEAVAGLVDDVPGVRGQPDVSAAFAGAWASIRKVAVSIEQAQRFYQLHTLIPAAPMPGRLRLAVAEDLELLTDWAAGFERDAQGNDAPAAPALSGMMSSNIERSLVWIWEHDQPVSMSAASQPVGGVSRIRSVYTPPEHRNQGWAAVCVSALVARLMSTGVERCVLFTDLANPTSNAIYQRLGFEPHSEHVEFRFGP